MKPAKNVPTIRDVYKAYATFYIALSKLPPDKDPERVKEIQEEARRIYREIRGMISRRFSLKDTLSTAFKDKRHFKMLAEEERIYISRRKTKIREETLAEFLDHPISEKMEEKLNRLSELSNMLG